MRFVSVAPDATHEARYLYLPSRQTHYFAYSKQKKIVSGPVSHGAGAQTVPPVPVGHNRGPTHQRAAFKPVLAGLVRAKKPM